MSIEFITENDSYDYGWEYVVIKIRRFRLGFYLNREGSLSFWSVR